MSGATEKIEIDGDITFILLSGKDEIAECFTRSEAEKKKAEYEEFLSTQVNIQLRVTLPYVPLVPPDMKQFSRWCKKQDDVLLDKVVAKSKRPDPLSDEALLKKYTHYDDGRIHVISLTNKYLLKLFGMADINGDRMYIGTETLPAVLSRVSSEVARFCYPPDPEPENDSPFDGVEFELKVLGSRLEPGVKKGRQGNHKYHQNPPVCHGVRTKPQFEDLETTEYALDGQETALSEELSIECMEDRYNEQKALYRKLWLDRISFKSIAFDNENPILRYTIGELPFIGFGDYNTMGILNPEY